jgi:hypothetical protein
MFCPKCATQNLDGASFCRSCGANISLVPQALTGEIVRPEANVPEERHGRRRRHGRELTLDQAFKNVFIGIAFLFISIALSRSGQGWWFWMLIPAFSLMGTGLAQFLRIREKEKQALLNPPPATPVLPERPLARPSVTEGTTRHLDHPNHR